MRKSFTSTVDMDEDDDETWEVGSWEDEIADEEEEDDGIQQLCFLQF